MRHPFGIGQVPLYGLADAGFKGFVWLPTEFALDLAGVDGVAPVVAGPVPDQVEGVLRLAEGAQDGLDDLAVALLAVGADEVGLADPAALRDDP